MKRFFDILLTSLAVLVLSPLLVPIMIILKLTGEHYIFYCQERVGKDRKPFGLMKFATMLKDSPNIGTGDITTRHDPRVLPFGRFLRKTKINELPQLFNILKGDMSIIGPRPLTPRNFAYYSPEIQQAIGELRPGLSGIGSVIFRDEERYLAGAKKSGGFLSGVHCPLQRSTGNLVSEPCVIVGGFYHHFSDGVGNCVSQK